MPFIIPKTRDLIKTQGYSACETVGELCYVFYEHLIKTWNDEPRWKTAHRLYDFECDPMNNEFVLMVYDQVANKFEADDIAKAASLAYKVFFELIVIPYERKQQELNGDIHG